MTSQQRERDSVAGPDNGPEPPYPLRLSGKVIKGFGRGSSELGIPTANIPLTGLSVGGHDDVESGVYFGWAGLSPSKATHEHPPGSSSSEYTLIDSALHDALSRIVSNTPSTTNTTNPTGAVYPMVMSIGWNPFYKNTVRSVEVHIMDAFGPDFYDSHMNLSILGFIRPELDYSTKEKLIEDIKTDINVAGRSLSRPAYAKFASEDFLTDFKNKEDVAS